MPSGSARDVFEVRRIDDADYGSLGALQKFKYAHGMRSRIRRTRRLPLVRPMRGGMSGTSHHAR